uniref:Uncharacterized protein n=1 Tax=Catagonus wagneri TaxID=51154 RepID=A0A8C3X9X8_9CETA
IFLLNSWESYNSNQALMLTFFFSSLPIFVVSVCQVQLQPWFPGGGRF